MEHGTGQAGGAQQGSKELSRAVGWGTAAPAGARRAPYAVAVGGVRW